MLRLLQNGSVENQGDPIPPSPEELTAEMLAQYFQMVEWLMDLRMTEAQRSQLKVILSGYFQRDDKERIKRFKNHLKEYDKLVAMLPEKRRQVQCSNIPHLLQELEQEIDKNDIEAAWLKQLYFSVHRVLVKGTPPLTYETADAWLSLDSFIRQERKKLQEKKKWKLTTAPKPSLARQKQILLKRWKGMSIEDRYKLYRLPGELTELKRQWPAMAEKDRFALIMDIVLNKRLLLNEVPGTH